MIVTTADLDRPLLSAFAAIFSAGNKLEPVEVTVVACSPQLWELIKS
jgi:hypothetical protein